MNRIKELRTKFNKNQNDMAEMLHVNRTTLTKWETGKHNPDVETVLRLADYFNVSTDYLLGKSDIPNNTLYVKTDSSDQFTELNKLPEEIQKQIVEYYELQVMKHLKGNN